MHMCRKINEVFSLEFNRDLVEENMLCSMPELSIVRMIRRGIEVAIK